MSLNQPLHKPLHKSLIMPWRPLASFSLVAGQALAQKGETVKIALG